MQLESSSVNEKSSDDNGLALEEIEQLKLEISAGYESVQVRNLLARVTLSTTFQFTGLLDLKGNHLQPSISANRATGVNCNDVIGKPIWEHPCWQDMPETQLMLKNAIIKAASGEFVRFDAFHHIGNKLAIFDFSLNPVKDREGKVIFLTAEGRDVSEQRQLEQEVTRQKEELAQLDKLKTQFFENISHEFRTPLTLILGIIEETLLELDTENPIIQRERLQAIQRNTFRLLKLVNQLLDFAAIEADRIQAIYQPTDLAVLTVDLASMFRAAIESAGICLVVDCPPLPEAIYVDRAMWEKIVLNLLSNAFKHTFEGKIELQLHWAEEEVTLTIRDTGVGISREHLPKLFERFYKISEARSRTLEGSGIGLALVQELVNLHHGRIMVDSIVDQGTTFSVSIPTGKAHLPKMQIKADTQLDSVAPKAQPFIAEALSWLPEKENGIPKNSQERDIAWYKTDKGDKVRILLAEDNTDMRGYLERLLAYYCDLESVPDGYSAMVAARRHPPDLILTDVMMPKMDGLQLLATVREDPSLKGIPVVFLSARAGEDARIEALLMGADDYIIKPFDKRDLLARIKANLNLELHRMSREAERARQFSEARFKRLINANIIGIFSGKLVDGLITEANDYVLEMLGYTRADLENGKLNWKQLTPPEYAQMDEAKVIESLEKGFLNPFEKQYIHKDGHIVDIILGAAILENSKDDFICYVIDMSSKKQIEKELSNYMVRLQQSNKELEHFATIASHDLQEPLRKVILFSDHLQMRERQSLSIEGLSDLERIQRATIRMQRLINDLLDLSRIIRKRKRFCKVDLSILTNEVIAELSCNYPDIRNRVSFSGSVLIDADPDQIHQMLSQLVDNGLKFHAPNKINSVEIEILPTAEQNCRIKISDNGIGIKQEFLSRIFDTFVRLNSEKEYPGTGIGLAMVKRIVERHNGTITVISTPGEGSLFTITLPISQVHKEGS